jgi:hypothetical protein
VVTGKNGLPAVAGVQNRVHKNKSQVGHSTYLNNVDAVVSIRTLHISAKGKSPSKKKRKKQRIEDE